MTHGESKPSVIQRDKKGNILYCIAYDHRGTLKFVYVHSINAGGARYHFLKTIPRRERRHVYVINVAPAVGFFVNDKHGDKLSTN